jgi:hypothetical protein
LSDLEDASHGDSLRNVEDEKTIWKGDQVPAAKEAAMSNYNVYTTHGQPSAELYPKSDLLPLPKFWGLQVKSGQFQNYI